MKKLILPVLLLFIFIGCADKNETSVAVNINPEDTAKVSFLPVTSFIREQMAGLDTLPITFLQVNTVAGKVDSAWLSADKLKPLLMPFINDEIGMNNLTPFFKESKFNDQGTAAVTFTYTPKGNLPDTLALRHWDVYVYPETGNIKKVYLLKHLKINNQDYTKQLTWQTDKWAKMVTILNKPDGSSQVTSDVKIVWDLSNGE